MSRHLRKLGLISTAATALLACLAIVGALLGPGRIRPLAGSAVGLGASAAAVLLLVLWTVVLAVRRRSGAALACAGAGLVLAGGLWGSGYAHALRKDAFGDARIASGVVALPKGQAVREVVDRSFSRRLGQLPFELRLDDFQTDYYEPPGGPWRLILVDADEQGRMRAQSIPWRPGTFVPVPSSQLTLDVATYLPHAVPRFAEGDRARLEVRDDGEVLASLPAREGEEASLPRAGIELRVAADPEPGESGYVKVEVTAEGRRPEILFVPAGGIAPLGPDGMVIGYLLPAPIGAEPGGESDPPAIQYAVRHGGASAGGWLFAGSELSARRAGEQLAGIDPGIPAGGALLRLVPPIRHVRQYRADVSVLAGGRDVARRSVLANHPLHYGGYDFCLVEHDVQEGGWVVMSVRSDAGLGLVFAGMALLVCGTIWVCWLRPAIRLGRGKEADDGR